MHDLLRDTWSNTISSAQLPPTIARTLIIDLARIIYEEAMRYEVFESALLSKGGGRVPSEVSGVSTHPITPETFL